MADRPKQPRTWGGALSFLILLVIAPFGIMSFIVLWHALRWLLGA